MDPDTTATYVQQLTGCQNRLYAYIYSLVGNSETARDVLQETNAVLWRKAEEYDSDRPFLPWALRIALNQVRAARTRLGRDRLVFHDEQTLESLSGEWLSDAPSDMEIELSSRNRDVVERHYRHDESLSSIAKTLNRTANAVGVMLHRIRRALAECIERTLHPNPLGEEPVEGSS
jgi:RNA polymerase sigma-70 factor (ECF subfamily)